MTITFVARDLVTSSPVIGAPPPIELTVWQEIAVPVQWQSAIPVHPPLRYLVGDQWQLVFVCTKSDGSPLDLTDADIEWRLLGLDDSLGTVTLVRTNDDDIAVIGDAVQGICILTLDGVDTAMLYPGFYQDQLQVTTAIGALTTQAIGRIEAVPSLFVAPAPVKPAP
jgi:hypothetical protein